MGEREMSNTLEDLKRIRASLKSINDNLIMINDNLKKLSHSVTLTKDAKVQKGNVYYLHKK